MSTQPTYPINIFDTNVEEDAKEREEGETKTITNPTDNTTATTTTTTTTTTTPVEEEKEEDFVEALVMTTVHPQ